MTLSDSTIFKLNHLNWKTAKCRYCHPNWRRSRKSLRNNEKSQTSPAPKISRSNKAEFLTNAVTQPRFFLFVFFLHFSNHNSLDFACDFHVSFLVKLTISLFLMKLTMSLFYVWRNHQYLLFFFFNLFML